MPLPAPCHTSQPRASRRCEPAAGAQGAAASIPPRALPPLRAQGTPCGWAFVIETSHFSSLAAFPHVILIK